MNEMVSAEKASFEADWETDAASRDFTVNALYIGNWIVFLKVTDYQCNFQIKGKAIYY